MAKTKISEFSATPGNNTDIDGINIAEGCAPSGINDAIRELMAQLKDFQAGTAGDSFNGPVGTTTAAAGAFTTLTTSGAVTHNGGTANGVAYLNGSKVLTTGSALTFDGTNFAVGTSTASTGIRLVATPISSANYFNNTIASFETNTSDGLAIYRPAATTIGFKVNSSREMVFGIGDQTPSEIMRLTSTGLGIGTSSPSAKLHVSGGRTLAITGNESYSLGIGRESNTNAYYLGVHSTTNPNLLFSNNAGTTNMTLTYDGNLGLGVTPSAVSVSDKVVQVGAFLFNNNTNGYGILRYNNFFNGTNDVYYANGSASAFQMQGNAFKWYTAPSGTAGNAISFTQAMTLDASGNLGVGTTSPQSRLDVAGASSTTGFVRWTDGVTATGFLGVDSVSPFINSNNGILRFGTSASNVLTERARIDSSGNLLVGTTNSAVNVGVGAKIIPSGSFWAVGATGDYFSAYNSSAAAFRFYVSTAGNISATNTTISAISDKRLKENIQDLDVGLDKIMALRPRKFDWKPGKGKDIKGDRGWIAQEFEQVFPDMIDEWRDPAPEGEEPYKSVRADLIPVLVKALQEMKQIVDAQAARIAALEAK